MKKHLKSMIIKQADLQSSLEPKTKSKKVAKN